MRLQSIELNNYRPYHGTSEELVFDSSEGSNIFIIQGRNGAGKTSLHEAISWCLYAPSMGGGRSHYKKINRTALDNGEEEMYVRLKFDHDGDFYNVVRKAEVINNGKAKTRLEILRNGEPVSGNEERRQNLLENILPMNVSEFLFFDGEEMEKLAKKMNGDEEEEEVKSQIELLIGLKAVQNAVTDFEYVKNKIDDEIDKERKKVDEKEEQTNELEDKKEEKEQLEEEVTELEEKISGLEDKKEGVEARLSKIESEELEELTRLETEIEKLEEDRIPELQGQYQDLIQYGHIFILYDSIEDAIEEFKIEKESIDAQLNELNISDAKKEMVQSSLVEMSCELCGQGIDSNAESTLSELQTRFEIDEQERSKLENKRVQLSERIEQMQDALRATDGDSPADVKQEIERLQDEITDKKEEYEELNNEVQSTHDDKSRLQGEKQKLESSIRNETSKLQKRKDRIDTLSGEINSLREEIDSISRNSVMEDLEKQTEAIQECIDDLDSLRDGLVKKKRDSILYRANTIFQDLTADDRGYKRFEFIDEDKYGFQIISDDETRPEMDDISQGEKQIVAFSFIMGLNQYADRNAPLVMDTPIARLDMEYRQNLAALLSDLDEQIILLVTDASLVGGFEEILKDDVVRKWEIDENTSERTSDFAEATL